MILPRRRADRSEGRKPQSLETKIEQALIDIAMRQELPKCGGKVGQVAVQVECFEEAHAAANLESFRLGEFARIVIIE